MSKKQNPRPGEETPADTQEHASPSGPDVSGHPSPGSGEADDAEITLDDYQERTQPKPRLPEQRRDVSSFEMGGVRPHAHEQAEVPFTKTIEPAMEDGWEPVTPDEIETYDPASDGALVSPAPAPPPPQPRLAENLVSPGVDELEEFIAKTASDVPVVDKSVRTRKPLSMVEKICTGAGVVIVLFLAFWLVRSATGAATGGNETSGPWPDLPIKGSLVTIKKASTNWRKRNDTDHVAQMEVLLPTPGFEMPDLIPQVKFSIDSSASSNGYLRFIFKDSDRKPRGDTRVLHVENGKTVDMGNGEAITGDGEGSAYGSYGLISMSAYYSYIANDEPRWSVEVSESSAYDADDKDWKILDIFDIRNELAR